MAPKHLNWSLFCFIGVDVVVFQYIVMKIWSCCRDFSYQSSRFVEWQVPVGCEQLLLFHTLDLILSVAEIKGRPLEVKTSDCKWWLRVLFLVTWNWLFHCWCHSFQAWVYRSLCYTSLSSPPAFPVHLPSFTFTCWKCMPPPMCVSVEGGVNIGTGLLFSICNILFPKSIFASSSGCIACTLIKCIEMFSPMPSSLHSRSS